MNEKYWRILDTLYNERNITRAAQKLFISQPALTYRIKLIEEEFGVTIVKRNKKGVQFTAEGEYLVKYAKKMLQELQRTREYLHNMSDKVQGILRLGVSSNFAHYRLPTILKRFLHLYPDVQVIVTTGFSSEVMKTLQNGDVHIGIVRGDYDWKEQKILINEEEICIISKEPIDVRQLHKLKKINFKTDPILQQLINDWWHQHFDRPPLTIMEVDKVQTAKEMVKSGLGYAIVPQICVHKSDRLHSVSLTSYGKVILRKTWLFYANSVLEWAAVKAFVNFVKSNPNFEGETEEAAVL